MLEENGAVRNCHSTEVPCSCGLLRFEYCVLWVVVSMVISDLETTVPLSTYVIPCYASLFLENVLHLVSSCGHASHSCPKRPTLC